MAPRLRVPFAPIAEGRIELPDATARYVFRVHRLSESDAFVMFDPELALEADARVVDPLARTVTVGKARASTAIAQRKLTVVQGLAKGDKMDAIVRDATELGATRIAPAMASRSVAAHSGKGAVERWKRIALEAARQSGRGDMPRIEPPRPLAEVLREVASDTERRFVLAPGGERTFGDALTPLGHDASVAVVIGPEGGLDADELESAAARGFERVTLGEFVLRTETACAAALGAILAIASQGKSNTAR